MFLSIIFIDCIVLDDYIYPFLPFSLLTSCDDILCIVLQIAFTSFFLGHSVNFWVHLQLCQPIKYIYLFFNNYVLLIQKRHYLSDYIVATRPENRQGKFERSVNNKLMLGFLKNQSFLQLILRNYQFIYIT